jgi:hypothetical protein
MTPQTVAAWTAKVMAVLDAFRGSKTSDRLSALVVAYPTISQIGQKLDIRRFAASSRKRQSGFVNGVAGRNERRESPQTNVPAYKMLSHARKSGSTGRTAASRTWVEWLQWARSRLLVGLVLWTLQ